MAIEFRLPQFGMGMTDGTVTKWLKAEGDAVSEGEIIVEVEAAKMEVEVPSPASGVLKKILVNVEENVPVLSVLALIDAEGEAQAESPIETVEPAAKTQVPKLAAAAEPGAHPQKSSTQVEPAARKLAKEHGIDLSTITGSGPNGRIRVADVQALADQDSAQSTKEEPQVKQTKEADEFVEIPHTQIRRIIARRLTESKRDVPHFYLKANCQIDAMLSLRKTLNEKSGSKVSVNDLVIRAVALALKAVPDANVSWMEDAMRRFNTVDVSVAVDTPRGLITPIVRDADSKSVQEIAAEVKELAARAQKGRLKQDEYTGGMVSVSNLGMFGVEEFSAILNPPQALIFAIGAGLQKPWVSDGKLEIATIMTVTVSVDHRAVDGALGAKVLAEFKSLIESPDRLV